MSGEELRLYQANPHQYGPGKVHLVDPGETSKTVCGIRLVDCPGKFVSGKSHDCKKCPNVIEARARHATIEAEAIVREAERVAEKSRADAAWWATYNAYLKTTAWHDRRRKVIEREGGLCQGCRVNRGSQVHHLTYQRVTRELLTDLVLLCNSCHELAHEDKHPGPSHSTNDNGGAKATPHNPYDGLTPAEQDKMLRIKFALAKERLAAKQ